MFAVEYESVEAMPNRSAAQAVQAVPAVTRHLHQEVNKFSAILCPLCMLFGYLLFIRVLHKSVLFIKIIIACA
jgi:hypothetical protein